MYTMADVEALEKAIASGVLSLRDPSGRIVTYQSLDAMRAARREMLTDLSASSRKRTFRVSQSGNGY